MKLIIHWFEGEFAICEKEDQDILYVNRRELHIDAKEGDVLILHDNNIKTETAQMC